MTAFNDPATTHAVVFGEVLFDVFPDAEVLGGAPFNVAWHLAGFGMKPRFISRIGDDERGERVQAAMERWGMDTGGLQVDDERATGVVAVTITDNEPSYKIAPDQAFDFIDASAALELLETMNGILLYHGTLAARNPVSSAALDALTARSGGSVFTDVNLRDPWWDADSVNRRLGQTRWLKLNEMELKLLMKDMHDKNSDEPKNAFSLMHRHDIHEVIVTRGEEGACIVTRDRLVSAAKKLSADEFKDSVGAGDAFSAVVMTGILNDWDADTMLNRAVEFAARICGIRGATTEDRSIYDETLASWGGGA